MVFGSIFEKFKRGLQKTATSLSRTIMSVVSDQKVWDESTYEQIEATLLQSDFGFKTTRELMKDIRDRYQRGLIKTSSDIVETISNDIRANLGEASELPLQDKKLTVILMVGINGTGKTTTTGKLAKRYKDQGYKVMLAAADTFRAAAVEQLHLWGERTQCPVISAKQGADPAAVAFDAVSAALARGMDILIIDTAGRQHTKKGLMDELAKVTRVIQKVLPEAPHHVLLTIDASMGSNAVAQANAFREVSGVTGLVLTKLDGTGRGGIVVAIRRELELPIWFVGLGEQPDDLQPFDPQNYIQALFSEDGAY